jgi:hypothetical protein
MPTFRAPRLSALAALSLAAVLAGGACAPAPFDAEKHDGSGGSTGGGGSGSGGTRSGGNGGSSSGGSGGTGAGGTTAGGTGGELADGSGGSGGNGPSGGGGSQAGGTGGSDGDASVGTGGTGGGTGGSSGSGGSSGDAGTTDGAAAAATFTQLYTQIFSTATCAGSACHNPGTSDNVSFKDKATSYSSLVPRTTASILMTRLETTDISKRMPKNKPALSSDLIQKVKDWIAAGAKNN